MKGTWTGTDSRTGTDWMRYWDQTVRVTGDERVRHPDECANSGRPPMPSARWSSSEIPRGEILGPARPLGSGKTTVLRLLGIGGSRRRSDRTRGGRRGTAVPRARPAALRGWCSSITRVSPPSTWGRMSPWAHGTERRTTPRWRRYSALVGLEGFERRRVQELSGGQQQRVARAAGTRARAARAALDEPLSNLTRACASARGASCGRSYKRVGITDHLLLTHEQEEAFDLGDRVAVLRAGRLEQLATADETVRAPAACFVATFVGRANVLARKLAQILGAAPVRCSCPARALALAMGCGASCGSGGIRAPPRSTWSRRSRAIDSKCLGRPRRRGG